MILTENSNNIYLYIFSFFKLQNRASSWSLSTFVLSVMGKFNFGLLCFYMENVQTVDSLHDKAVAMSIYSK